MPNCTAVKLNSFAGGRASEPEAVRGDAGPDRAAAGVDRIERVAEQRQDLLTGLVEEEVLQKCYIRRCEPSLAHILLPQYEAVLLAGLKSLGCFDKRREAKFS